MIIKINEIQLFGYHGLYQEEKENGQNFIISLLIDIDYKDKSDKIENTLDYVDIIDQVKNVFSEKRYNLIGRYKKDKYYNGHSWIICSLALVQVFYKLYSNFKQWIMC